MKKASSLNSFVTGIVLFVLGIGIIAYKNAYTTQVASTTFASEPVQVQGFEISEEIPRMPVRVIIPDVKIDLEVKESKAINGYWEVYEHSAGWGEGSGVPGESGNQVIFAHARDGLFAPLKDLNIDQKIYVLAQSQTDDLHEWYAYTVVETKEVSPNETEVIAPTGDETLTLYTCSGYNDEKRLILVAKRMRGQ